MARVDTFIPRWGLSGRKPILAWAFIACVYGCGSKALTIPLNPPPERDARAWLLVALTPDGPPVARAATTLSEDTLELPLMRGAAHADVYALAYRYPLDVLGFGSDQVELGSGRPIPNPDVVFRTRVEPKMTGAWQEARVLPEPISGLHLAETQPEACESTVFDVSTRDIELPGEAPSARSAAALPLGDNSALLLMRSGQAFRVTTSGAERVEALSRESYFGGFVAPDGELWIASSDGVLHGHPDRGFTQAPRFSSPLAHHVWMDGIIHDGITEILSITDFGIIERFDGSTWTTIAELDVTRLPPSLGATAVGGVRFIQGTRTALVLQPDWISCATEIICGLPTDLNNKIYQVEGERLTSLDVPSAFGGTALTALHVSPYGDILAGETFGNLVLGSADGWVSIGNVTSAIWTMETVRGGIVISSGRGDLTLWNPIVGLCPPHPTRLGHIRHIVPLGDSYLLARDSDVLTKTGGDQATILSWRRKGSALSSTRPRTSSDSATGRARVSASAR